MGRMRKSYIPTAKGLVHAQEAGEGDRVIVFVTLLSIGGVLMEPVLEGLASRGYRAAALDLMGYGRSDKRDGVWDIATFAANIEDALQAAGLANCLLVCGHFSCFVGIEIAAARRTHLRGLVLDGTPMIRTELREAFRAGAAVDAPVQWHQDGRHALEYWQRSFSILRMLDPALDALDPLPSPRIREATLALLEVKAFEPGTMPAAAGFEIEQRLSRIDIPSVVLCSERDWNRPHHDSIVALLPEARAMLLPGIHPLHEFTRPERANEYVDLIDGIFAQLA